MTAVPASSRVSDIRQPPVRRIAHDGTPASSSAGAPFYVLPLEDARGFRLVGELDLSTVGLLLAALDTLPAGANVLDLAELSFMDASGLHALEGYAGSLNGAAPLVLENVPPWIQRLFHITGAELDPDIEIRMGAAGG
jgi:anti-anti-sigma factor